jgi:predicted O-methyltransferase YrrM
MNKAALIGLLFKNPLSVLKRGLLAQQELSYKSAMLSAYNIDQLPTVDMRDLFGDFTEELSSYSFLDGTSPVTDIILLKQLARKFPDCNYLEIGSWRGESIKNISEVATHCTSLTLSPHEMKELGISKGFIDVHGLFSKGVKNMSELLHNSQTYDFSKINQVFDLIFIDGDHTYEGVLNDTKKTFGLRKNASSVIVWHDYGFSAETVRPSVLKAILDGIPREKHKNLYHVSNTMSAIYMEDVNLPTYNTQFPTLPNKKFSVKVTVGEM